MLLQVWDTGPGIAADNQARAFDEFVQFDNPARDAARGHGLGLATVHRLAGLLGHDLRARSRPGRGSCFELDMPAGRSAAQTPAAENTVGSEVAEFSGRALVLDDHGPSRDAVAQLLTRWGLRCSIAATVAEAESLRAQHSFDAIVTDYRLPGDEDGIALAGRWLAERPAPRMVCVISGEASAPAVMPHGIDWLAKPLRPARLRALLTHRLLDTG